jgi:hypothetical protein
MLKTTTKASLLDRELTPKEQRMSDYYDKVCGVPDSMKGTLPFSHDNYIITKLYDDWLGPLFGKVQVDYTEIEGKHYYRVALRVLNRKHWFVLVPFSAYMKANVIGTMQRMGIMEHMVYEGITTIYIPTWARRAVYEECRTIYKIHRAEIDGHVAMMDSLNSDEDGKDVSATLH